MSREHILNAIKDQKLEIIGLPKIDLDKLEFTQTKEEQVRTFIDNAKATGAQAIHLTENEIQKVLLEEYGSANKVCDFSKKTNLSNFEPNETDVQELEATDVIVLEASFGVIENGAVWLTENQFPLRVLPFITKKLVILLDKNKLVTNMHRAYELLQDTPVGYGVFISGPSKTADIEHSLVIGAQGALSTTLFIY